MFENVLKSFKWWETEDDKEFKRNQRLKTTSVAPQINDDGAIEVEVENSASSQYNALFQQFFGVSEPNIKTTKDLINMYRALIQNHEVDNAVDEIVNDAIVQEDNNNVVSLNLDSTGFSESIKTKIIDEFSVIQNLYEFNHKANILFKNWYIDSRIFFHKIYGTANKGIIELRQLDPRNLELVREVHTDTENGIKVVKGTREYFIYTNTSPYVYNGITYDPNSKIKIPRSAVAYAHSGLTQVIGMSPKIIGYLHRAMKPANQLKMLEDAMVIYRITRAPERRVFYVDVGNMPAKKATQYVNGVMQSLKNRVVYDSATGTIKNQKNNMSMTEDYWLMRRDGKSATDVTSLPGAQGMNEMDDVRWFNRKLYEALHIPLTRLPQEGQSTIIGGAGTEITRDELNFAKFIRKLRVQFSEILYDPLRSQLLMKRIITEDEWEEEKNNIQLVFHNDSYFNELKSADILQRRIDVMTAAEPFIGRYLSHTWVMKEILNMSDEEIKEQQKQIEEDAKNPNLQNRDEIEDEF